MTRIYTRRGDEGETGLFGGARVLKSDPRVASYGEIDELNAVLGWVATQVEDRETRQRLTGIQADLFTIGGHLATPPGARSGAHLPPLPVDRPAEFEAWIDRIEAELEPLDAFILPGGAPAGAALHLARTVCRRAERAVVALAAEEEVAPEILVYLNRLSDLLFDLARRANRQAAIEETRWQPRS